VVRKIKQNFVSGETYRVAVSAVDEAGAEQNYEVTGLKEDTEYGFRLYSSADARRSPSSTLFIVRTARNGQYRLICYRF